MPFTVTGTTTQRADIATALTNCRYDFAALTKTIPVTFTDLTKDDAEGLFWTSGRIEIERTLTGRQAQAVFLSEAWHAVDQFVLTNADRAALLGAAHPGGPDRHTWFDTGGYYQWVGEAMMDVFVTTYTDYPVSGIPWEHPVRGAVVDTLRSILTPVPAPGVGGYVLGPPSTDNALFPTQTQTLTHDGAPAGTVAVALYSRLGRLRVRSSLRP